MKAIADFGTLPGINGANIIGLLQEMDLVHRPPEKCAVPAYDNMAMVLKSTSAETGICYRADHVAFDILC